MARRKKQQFEAEAPLPPPEDVRQPGIDAFRILKFAGLTLAVVVSVFFLGWLIMSGEAFLSNDARFLIAAEDLPGEPPAIEITGARNASRKAILEVFDQDRGRSLFKLDPNERKRRIDDLPWVRSAAVRRIWPNHVAVEITERAPVAFVEVPTGVTGSMENPIAYKPMLIDDEGGILGVKSRQALALPLLKGVRINDPKPRREARVRLLIRLLDELAPYRGRIPEVDLSAAPNVAIAYEIQGVTVELLLGSESWRKRLDYFTTNVDSIRHVLRDRVVLDLSIDERVIMKSAPEPPRPEEGSAAPAAGVKPGGANR